VRALDAPAATIARSVPRVLSRRQTGADSPGGSLGVLACGTERLGRRWGKLAAGLTPQCLEVQMPRDTETLIQLVQEELGTNA
jgi:hypothetical protein